jgi:hypothetical protein
MLRSRIRRSTLTQAAAATSRTARVTGIAASPPGPGDAGAFGAPERLRSRLSADGRGGRVPEVEPTDRGEARDDLGGLTHACSSLRRYLMSVSILNIGRYIEMTIVPTMAPTPIISTGSMIEVSDWMLASTSSS